MAGLLAFFSPKTRAPIHLEFDKAQEQTELSVVYDEAVDESARLVIMGATQPLEISFDSNRIDEVHILYMEATEILHSRAKAGENAAAIEVVLRQLIDQYSSKATPARQDTTLPTSHEATNGHSKESLSIRNPQPVTLFIPNPGKQLEIDVAGTTYLRLPVKTRLITEADTDILPLVEEYVVPHLHDGDLVFVSEKALTITQGRVVDFHDIHPGALARFLARNIRNNYGTQNFKGFGHGTSIAMQLFIEEAGYPRIILAAVVAAVTRPLGITGMFYRISGTRAKSIDCPMSFTIIKYAHAAKLAPNNTDGEARRIATKIGHEVVILDANYRGAFSLGKSNRAISEKFIQDLFRDNPLGQSDEMTPFAIVRRK